MSIDDEFIWGWKRTKKKLEIWRTQEWRELQESKNERNEMKTFPCLSQMYIRINEDAMKFIKLNYDNGVFSSLYFFYTRFFLFVSFFKAQQKCQEHFFGLSVSTEIASLPGRTKTRQRRRRRSNKTTNFFYYIDFVKLFSKWLKIIFSFYFHFFLFLSEENPLFLVVERDEKDWKL